MIYERCITHDAESYRPGAFHRLLFPESLTLKYFPWMRVGMFVQDTRGETWQITTIGRKDPDDWFSDELYVVCHKPWKARPPIDYKIEWLEDELLPRLTARA